MISAEPATTQTGVPLLSWDDLHVLLVVCRAGGLAPAGRQLKLDHSTVSRRVSRLEQTLGEKLFERQKDRLVLTACGHRVLVECQRIGDVVEQVLNGCNNCQTEAQQPVRLGLREGMATLHISTLLTKLRERAPEVRLEITHSAQLVAFSRRDADLFLGLSHVEAAGIFSEPLGSCPIGLYASADYLSQRGVPKSVDDLARHDFIDCVPEHTPEPLRDLLGTLVHRPKVVLRSTTALGQWQAALGNCGIVAFSEKAAAVDGRLQPVLPGVIRKSLTVWLCRHEQMRERRAIKEVVGLLRAQWA
jgi:DNA-binding transcriptional LysR family regulator